jgi:hypothetical protein
VNETEARELHGPHPSPHKRTVLARKLAVLAVLYPAPAQKAVWPSSQIGHPGRPQTDGSVAVPQKADFVSVAFLGLRINLAEFLLIVLGVEDDQCRTAR